MKPEVDLESSEQVRNIVIAFEARLFHDFVPLLHTHQGKGHGPGPRKHVRVDQRRLVENRVGVPEKSGT